MITVLFMAGLMTVVAVLTRLVLDIVNPVDLDEE